MGVGQGNIGGIGSAIAIVVLLVFLVFFIIFGAIICIKWTIKRRKAMKKHKEALAEEKARIGYLERGRFLHCTGLPIMQDVACDVLYFRDKIMIMSSGLTFNLELHKIYDMQVKSDVDIQNSRIDLPIFGAGGISYGSGTIKSKTITNYLIITYDKDGETTYLAFYVTKQEYIANKMVELFKQGPNWAHKTVDL